MLDNSTSVLIARVIFANKNHTAEEVCDALLKGHGLLVPIDVVEVLLEVARQKTKSQSIDRGMLSSG
jgi:hypothetical protein